MSELLTRALTGAVLVAIVILATTYSFATSCALWGVLGVIGVKEVYTNKMGGVLGMFLVLLAAASTVSIGFLDILSSSLEYEGMNVVAFLTMIWANDTFAYLGGNFIGRKIISKGLAPSISPNKSWEGAFIGALAAAAVGWLWLFGVFGAVVGACIGIMATSGDLFVSKAKRSAGVKDTGTLLPGHGGVLDRFDGLVLAAPLTFIIIFFI